MSHCLLLLALRSPVGGVVNLNTYLCFYLELQPRGKNSFFGIIIYSAFVQIDQSWIGSMFDLVLTISSSVLATSDFLLNGLNLFNWNLSFFLRDVSL